jgi:hypothetical protein
MRTLIAAMCSVSMLLISVRAPAQAPAPAPLADIQKELSSLYQTAKPTADGTDLVTAGAVLVLQKDNLMMCKVDQPIPTPNFYKNGAINQGGLGGLAKLASAAGLLGRLTGNAAASAAGSAGGGAAASTRTFVAGEKFFVTRIATEQDGVVFTLMSDPIKDQRYKSTLKFPFAKGASVAPDDVAAVVAEVIKVDGGDAPADQANNASPAAPAPAPKTISIGQSRDQVVANFGVPSKVVQVGAKEIDFFADMKVTFLNNKVSNVE